MPKREFVTDAEARHSLAERDKRKEAKANNASSDTSAPGGGASAMAKGLGIFLDQSDSLLNADLDHIVAMGSRALWVPVDIAWLCPTSTAFDSSVIAKYDTAINGAQTRGLRVILQVHSNPSWMVTAGGHTYPGNVWHGPDNASERGNWLTCLSNFISRYGTSKIHYVEIWNEPHLLQFWQQGWNAQHYMELLRASWVAIKANWPTIKIVGHNMARADIGQLQQVKAWWDTVYGNADFLAKKGGCDIVGMHPYCGSSSVGYDPADNTHADETTDWGLLDPDYLGYRRIRSEIFTQEGVNKPIAFGEFGYPILGSGWYKLASDSLRASYLTAAMAFAAGDGYVEYFVPYYHWRHETPTDYWTSFNIHNTATETAFQLQP